MGKYVILKIMKIGGRQLQMFVKEVHVIGLFETMGYIIGRFETIEYNRVD